MSVEATFSESDPSLSPGRLRGGSLGAIGAAVMAMAFMGPATSVAFNTPAAAAKIGFALPFGIFLAMVACLIMASTIGSFSSKLPSAGFAYTFNTNAFNKGTGFVSGWLLVFVYGAIAPMLFSAMGGFGSQFLQSQFHWKISWWIISTAIIVIIWGIGQLGVSRSAKTSLIFLTLEIGVLVSLFATVVVRGGAQGNSLAPFNPAHSLTGISGIGFGMLWGILMFVGFESAGTLGEETRNPKKNISKALFIAVLLVGLIYVLSGYAMAIGYGHSHVGALASDSSPLSTLSSHFWGANIAWLITLTVLNSQFANVLSGSNAAVRVVFSLGREGILHRKLGTTNKKDNPSTALTSYILLSAAITYALGAWIGPFGAYNFLGSILGLGIIVLYIMMNIGLITFFRTKHRDEFNPLIHGVLPVLGSLLMLLPIYGQLRPVPPWPYNLIPYLILLWIVSGLVYYGYIRSKKPHLIDAMGRVWEPDMSQS